jgi:hypothetical protein
LLDRRGFVVQAAPGLVFEVVVVALHMPPSSQSVEPP